MELQLPKGVRDFPPEEMILRNRLITTLQKVFERYGFNPLETPSFERLDVLSAKYAGGAEILKETFRFKDQGGRDLALRYDLTVPLCRYVGMNPQLKLPFKRYAIGRVYRDGPTKLGRYREFYQCDADIVGTPSVLADAECIRVALAGFRELGLPVTISVNNRKLLEELLEKGGVPKEKVLDAMLVLDKLKKVGLDQVKKELAEKGISDDSVDFVVTISASKQSTREKLQLIVNNIGQTPGCNELAELFSYLEGVDNVFFDSALSRGLAYYTGTVFEGFVPDSNVTSSVCGGGRYDKMVSDFLGTSGPLPAVGFSFGLEPIMDVLKQCSPNEKRTQVKVYVIPIKTPLESVAIAERLRDACINVDIDLNDKSISKNLDYANSYGIPYVLIVGKRELEEGKVKLKEMQSGNETFVTVDEAISQLKD